MKKIISNKKVLLGLRVILGFFFIAASLDKIIFPELFKSIVNEYNIVPEVFLPFVAVILPWLEFLCGIFIILNIYTQSAALILIGVLSAYVAGIGQNLYVGLIHECGCFNLLGLNEDISFATIIRDLIFILIALPVLFYSKNELFPKKKSIKKTKTKKGK